MGILSIIVRVHNFKVIFQGYFPLRTELLAEWMIYLNDVTDGGHTEFLNQKKKYQPRTGDVLLYLHTLLTHIEELPVNLK